MNVDQLMVVAIDEVALQVEHVGESAGEPRAKIHTGATEHAHDAASHVLAAMIARTLDHCERAGIAHREALARLPAAYNSPPVAPYRQVLPMITVRAR